MRRGTQTCVRRPEHAATALASLRRPRLLVAAATGVGAVEVARSGRGLLGSGSANATSEQLQAALQVALEQRRGPGSGHESRRNGLGARWRK